ncbi:MAG: winged helix-turn-helix domain-containing protein [Gammaproteobacteria bacterium]
MEPSASAELAALLQRSTRVDDYRRVQGVYLRAAFDERNERIAAITGLAVGTIKNLHARYLRHGIGVLQSKPKGGRRHAHLSLADEAALVESWRRGAEGGAVVEVKPLQQAYEAKVGKAVARSTTYRLLHRHGWRKLTPRPQHPRADVQRQADFKKASTPSPSKLNKPLKAKASPSR